MVAISRPDSINTISATINQQDPLLSSFFGKGSLCPQLTVLRGLSLTLNVVIIANLGRYTNECRLALTHKTDFHNCKRIQKGDDT